MKNLIALCMLLLSFSASAKIVHLDCSAKITTEIPKSRDFGKVYDYKIDIDFEKETAKFGGWTDTILRTNPNEPEYKLTIGDEKIELGDDIKGKWGYTINRSTLEFRGRTEYSTLRYYEGSCVLVDKREKPKTAF